MRTDGWRTWGWSSVLLSILLLISLATPLTLLVSVGTVRASAPGHIVISELGTRGPAGGYDEFVELYNPTSSSVDISGWLIKYKSRTGTLWSFHHTIPENTTIQGFCFYLVVNTNGWSGGSYDYGGGRSGWADGGGHVKLSTESDVYVDKVGWGTAIDPEGSAAQPRGDSTDDNKSIQRKSLVENYAPCQDTENNAADFELLMQRTPMYSGDAPMVPDPIGLGVSVSISPSESGGLPETMLTYTVVTNNIGIVTDNYTLTVSDTENWNPTLDDNLFLNVGPGENGTTTLRVTIPVDANDAAEDIITVTTTSQENEYFKDNDSSKAICYLVPPIKHYKEYPIDDQTVMENLGNLSDNYKLDLSCGRYYEDDFPRERSFLKFDISSIPPEAMIENAYLGLYHHFGVYTEGRWCWVEVWTVENDNWTENEVDWSNQPPKIENFYQEYIDYAGFSSKPWLGTSEGGAGVPVKSYIENEIADGAASFMLYSPQEDLPPEENTAVDFSSKEDVYPEQWPYLEVWYYENAVPILFSVSVSPSSQGGWPGDYIEYTVTVKNRGTINDNYDLAVSDSAIPSWGPMLSDNLLDNVPSGENGTVTLSVTIPENEELATLDTITVTATSQTDNRISDSAEAIASGSGIWNVASESPVIKDYGVAVVGAGENIYIANSSQTGSNSFMLYKTVTDEWAFLSNPPPWLKNGTCFAWDNGDYLYALLGASYGDHTALARYYFYRYSIPDNNWEQLENTPGPQGAGDAITWVPGSALGTQTDWIYVTLGTRWGSLQTTFSRYNINGDNWETLTYNPHWVGDGSDDGSSLVWTGGDYLYALQGEAWESYACYDFWRYNIISNTWEEKENIPAYPHSYGSGGVGDGGTLLWVGGEFGDYIYALSGNQAAPEPIWDKRFYRYTISTNTWQRLGDMPGGVGDQNGPRLGLVRGSGSKIYSWRGCDIDPVLWVYALPLMPVPREVSVSISPSENSGSPGDTLNYTVTVTNIWVENDNFDLKVSDDENWGLSLSDNLLEILAGENENVTLSVTIPGDAEYCMEDLITVTATSRTNNTIKDSTSCIARTGTADFSLKNLYTVNVEKILDLNQGSKLVVKFYTYGDAYENENVVETFSPPWHVEENEEARHPEGIGVKKARLDLTTDNTENVISTIESFTVRKVHLETRFMDIPFWWSQADAEGRA
ncbi:hypothetical protein ES703_20951 [subsurface metagenome]